MALIDDVKTICDRLAPFGWRDLLLAVTSNTLDISQTTNTKLRNALTATIPTIDRSRSGFEDFHPSASQAVTAGAPAQSLLYHALASCQVHPTADGKPSPNLKHYPTLEELDTVENFIYSLAADRTDLAGTVVAVFAYQYRPASRTTHLRHADLAWSRTGVARVGTAAANYDSSRRSFWVIPKDGSDSLCVLPARYAVFLARKAKPGAAGSVLGGHRGLSDDDFLFPVHKLFDGRECIKGQTLTIGYSEFHRNEKLRMIHLLPEMQGGLPVPAGFNISKSPYVRDSTNGGNLASLIKAGSSVQVTPKPAATLVHTVSQKNTVTNTNQMVHFMVPPVKTVRGEQTRFVASTLQIPRFGADRLAPEYVNIRHQINPTGAPTQVPADLNLQPAAAFSSLMANGGYAAAHFSDDSCDGVVEATVSGLAAATPAFPAFSLITAPDFLPLADQSEVEADPTIELVTPLSKGRLPVNPTLPLPGNPTSFAFDRGEKTLTAVVGAPASGPISSAPNLPNRMVSFLPDAASNVFAPGWDTSRSRDAVGSFLTSSGLGSPFPEDAKLCAALASFWPAVAPDNGRTFGNQGFGNQLPMLDEELGFHPNHEGVRSGNVVSYRGWDGEFGPFIEKVGTKLHVNFVEIERSDYVSHALAGRIRVSLTAEVQSEDLIARHQSLLKCHAALAVASLNNVCLVVMRKIDDWATSGRGVPQLTGAGFLMEFAELSGVRKTTTELDRVRQEIRKRHVCQVGSNGLAYKNGTAAFVFLP